MRQPKTRTSVQPKPASQAPRLKNTHFPPHLRHILVLGLVFALGVFARTWEYGRLPPSLNPDETSAGVEAQSLLRYGEDRNGVAFPVKFISWGSGQDVLFAYLLMPVIGLLGLSPLAVRLPMLGFALATLPLTYLVARRTFGMGVGLMAAFMLAISPWHILLSRWALDSNLLPFVFLAAFACCLMVGRNGWWFLPCCVLLALCLYAYGTAYLVVPVFLLGSTFLLVRARALRPLPMWSGLATFVILAAPMALLVIVNGLSLSTLRLGPLTVPRFPVAVRWESTTLLGAISISKALGENAITALRLLATESDAIPYNVVEPYGLFYRSSLVLALAGLVLIVWRRELHTESRLLLLWLGAAACVGLVSAVNINRFNIICIPMIILGAYALQSLHGLHRLVGLLPVVGLLIAFSAFTLSYHGTAYRGIVDFKFQKGVIPSLLYAQRQASGSICVTDEINMPYIYALFTDPTSPHDFQASVKYVDPTEPLRRVASFGRYVFGIAGCRDMLDATYVMRGDDAPPRMGNRYTYEFFDNFVVYSPVR